MNPKFMCDRQCRKKSFRYHDIASVMVEDDGEPHDNARQSEWKEPAVKHRDLENAGR